MEMKWGIIDVAIIIFETFLYYWFFSEKFEFKYRGIGRIVLMLIFPVATYVMDHIIEFNSAKTFILFVIGVILVYFIYECTVIRSVLWNTLFIFLLIVSESISMGLLLFIHGREDFAVFLEHSFFRLQCVVLSKLINVILVIVCLKLVKVERKKYTLKEIAVLLLQAFSSVFCLIMIVELSYYQQYNYSWSMILLFILGLVVLFSYMLSYYYINLYFDYRDREEEILLIKMRNEKIINDFQCLENSQQKVYQLYHDIKKHLNIISMIKEKEEAQAYLDMCFEGIQNIEGMFRTGNRYIDMILYEEWKKSYKLGIKVQFAVEKDSLANVELHDVIIILGNALENAREACEKRLEIEKSAHIQLKIVKVGDQIFIVVSNDYIGKVIKQKNVFLTSKKDKDLHGIGMKSIQSSIEKYEGGFNVSLKGNKFVLMIMLNV